MFNRLWVRISLSYTLVLLAVLAVPVLVIWFAVGTSNSELGRDSYGFNSRSEERFEEHMPGFSGSEDERSMGLAPVGFLANILLATCFSAFVGILAGVVVSRNLSRPVTQLVEATQLVGPDNLSYRVKVKGVAELEELADSFNQMVAELERSTRERRHLLADVSHELLTPLTILEGNLRAILDDVYEMSKEEISSLYDQTHQLIRLVRDLRQLAQAEARELSLRRGRTDMHSLIEEILTLFAPLAGERKVSLLYEGPKTLPFVAVDRGRIIQVMNNLLSNGLRHTPAGGTITIRATSHEQQLNVSVTDSGEGLDPEETSNIFDRFYRTDDSRRRDAGGTGLGLAIVKAIISAHDGTVNAHSDGPGQGATFGFSLPTNALPD